MRQKTTMPRNSTSGLEKRRNDTHQDIRSQAFNRGCHGAKSMHSVDCTAAAGIYTVIVILGRSRRWRDSKEG